MEDLGYLAMTMFVRAPTLLVVLVGMVLAMAARRRLPRRPRRLVISGLAVLLLGELLGVAWVVLLPRVSGSSWWYANFQSLTMGYIAVQTLAYTLGLGLVIWAVFAGRATGTDQERDSATAPPTGKLVPSQNAPQWDGQDRPDTPSGADLTERD